MSEETERLFIERRCKQVMASLFPAFKIAYPNVKFKEPINASYGRLDIMSGPPIVAGGSSGRQVVDRHIGIVQLTIYAPEDSGTTETNNLATAFGKAFQHYRGRDDDGDRLNFKIAQKVPVGKVAGWYVTVVKVPYYRDSNDSVTV